MRTPKHGHLSCCTRFSLSAFLAKFPLTSARFTRLSLRARALIAPLGVRPLPAQCAPSGLFAESKSEPSKSESSKSEQAVNTQLDATLAANLDVVYRYALRLTRNPEQAQDLTQETMLRGWRSRHTLHDEAVAKNWLLRIATNLWTDQLRQVPHKPQLLVEPPTCTELSTSQKLIQQESVQQALAALDALPPRQRQVMYLITVEQLPHAEVAEILSLTAQAVKANLAAARKTLRTQLQDLYEELSKKKPCPPTQINVANANDLKPI